MVTWTDNVGAEKTGSQCSQLQWHLHDRRYSGKIRIRQIQIRKNTLFGIRIGIRTILDQPIRDIPIFDRNFNFWQKIQNTPYIWPISPINFILKQRLSFLHIFPFWVLVF